MAVKIVQTASNHYKRFESKTDSTKQIPLDKLVKISIILDKNLEEFFK